MVTFRKISVKEFNNWNENLIKEWHFEQGEKGLVPVKGKYDSNNPKHIKPSDIIKIHGG